MIDVGAHYGESHRWYLRHGWSVLAFEPDPSDRARIRRRSARLEVFDCAISDRAAAAAELFASDESTGISALAPFVASHRPVCRVPVTTLSALFQEGRFRQCDFLKIDTEGHDLFVLKGFPWEAVTPDVILCEFEDRKTVHLGYDHRDLGAFLLDHAYEVYVSEWAPIERYGVEHTWRRLTRYPAPLLDAGGWGNFVAFRGGHVPARLRRRLDRITARAGRAGARSPRVAPRPVAQAPLTIAPAAPADPL
jgi:FkbM family methyltransferase